MPNYTAHTPEHRVFDTHCYDNLKSQRTKCNLDGTIVYTSGKQIYEYVYTLFLTLRVTFLSQADFTSALCYSEQPNDDDGTSEVPDHQEYSHGTVTCKQFTAADAVH
jgi:hypothetical protein